MKFLKNKLAVTIIVLSVTFLGLIFYSVSKDSKGPIDSTAGAVLNPVQQFAYTINSKIKDFVDFFLNFSEVRAENKELKKENFELENKLAEYSGLAEENERLRGVLDFTQQRNEYNYIATDIIGFAGNSVLDGYIVNKGSDDGVLKDMIVISSQGLVGQVTSTGKNWAIIQNLLSENIGVSVTVESTSENNGILSGHPEKKEENVSQVFNLPMTSEIKEGDAILTSGHGRIYPKGIRVGEVISVEDDRVKVMKKAVVKPYVDFNKLEELFIVVPKETREIKY